MNESELLARLSALPDEAVHVDVDSIIATGKLRRLRRRSVLGVAIGTMGLVAGVILVPSQLGAGPSPPAVANGSGPWTVNSPDVKGANLPAIAAISETDVWAVGYRGKLPDLTGLAMHWDGKQWRQFDLPKLYTMLDVTAIASNDVWAVGFSRTPVAGQPNMYDGGPIALHWDGTGWREVAVPTNRVGADLSAVAAVSANDVWAVGTVAQGPNPPLGDHPFIVHWDGQRWQEVTNAVVPGAKRILLRSISARAADDVWVVGNSDDGSGERPLALHWDGRQWSVMQIPAEIRDVTDVVALAPDNALAVGLHSMFQWNGQGWRSVPVPAEVKGQFMTITRDGAGGIIAAGREFPVCDPDHPCTKNEPTTWHLLAARWNETAWTRIPPPVNEVKPVGFIQGLSTTSTGLVWAVGTIGDNVDTTTPIVASISFGR